MLIQLYHKNKDILLDWEGQIVLNISQQLMKIFDWMCGFKPKILFKYCVILYTILPLIFFSVYQYLAI